MNGLVFFCYSMFLPLSLKFDVTSSDDKKNFDSGLVIYLKILKFNCFNK